MDELKPCPFCGGSNLEVVDTPQGYFIDCSCGCFTGDFETREAAVDAWNTRTQIPGEVCELEGTGEGVPLPVIEDDRTPQLEALVLEMRADIYGAMCDMFSDTPWGLPAGTVYDERIAALGLEVGE